MRRRRCSPYLTRAYALQAVANSNLPFRVSIHQCLRFCDGEDVYSTHEKISDVAARLFNQHEREFVTSDEYDAAVAKGGAE